MEIHAIKTPVVKPGDDLARVLLDAMKSQGMELVPGDVIVAGEKVVATAQGRVVDLDTIADVDVPDKAREIGAKYHIDPRKVKVIMDESEEILGGVDTVLLTKSYGLLLANAGIDSSNAGKPTNVVLLPSDLWGTARRLREALEEASGVGPL
ncbi:MAG: coenzyme F420-0:L-glutamate ligase, partial [Candidatus Lokiarchaeota archaeon]|nr:coenzyme F420-0:L-glutamate ligase [Candidatus Lokiarchaeota archaeon]